MKNHSPDPATHPAVHAERQRMLEERRQKVLASKPTFKAPERVTFTGVSPMHRPVLDAARDLPQSAYRPGAFDHKLIPSRGW